MSKDIFKTYIYPIATLAGSIIGVGFLSLPYIALKVGIWPMLFYFIILTALIVFLHVIFAEISLKTPDHKRFPGFVGFYLGKFPQLLTLISIIFTGIGISIVYFIVGGQFLATIFAPFFGGSVLWYSLLYFALGSLVIYFGVTTISKVEFWALAILLICFFVIFITEFSRIKLGNIFVATPALGDWKTIFLPYGVIIFSLWGIGLIPELEEMLTGKKQLLKKIVVIGTLIPAIIYLLFIFLILGISGSQTTESALTGLKLFLGEGLFFVALSIGVVSTFTAFITQGLFLKKVLVYDMGVKDLLAWLLICFAPLILFLLGFNSFIPLISFIGGVILGINGILVLLMYRKIGGKKIIIYPLTLVFILGIMYEIIYFIK